MIRVVAGGQPLDCEMRVSRCPHGAVTVRAYRDSLEVVQFVFGRAEQREFIGLVPTQLLREELVNRVGDR
jgi:hypothetical protein